MQVVDCGQRKEEETVTGTLPFCHTLSWGGSMEWGEFCFKAK